MRQLKISRQFTNRENKSLDKYLSDISRVPMINAEEEVELAQRIREGDERGAHLHQPAERHGRVGIDQRAENDVMEIHDEENHQAGHRDKGRQTDFGRIFDDVRRARLRVADHHRDDRGRELQTERIEPGEHAIHHTDQ